MYKRQIFNRSAQALYPVNLTVPLPSDRRNFPGDADQTAFAEVRLSLIHILKNLLANQDVGAALVNSFKYAILLTIVSMVICSLAGYGFEIYQDVYKRQSCKSKHFGCFPTMPRTLIKYTMYEYWRDIFGVPYSKCDEHL